jgi:thiamine pyrophosphokinase
VSRTLYRAAGPVTLVGGGPIGPGALEAALAVAPEVVAADGGGDVALPGGARFRAVIGDMDSLRDAAGLAASGAVLHALVEQETTDLEKCLYSVEAPLIVGVGFLGGRLDHTLAAVNAVARHAAPLVLLGAVDLCFRCPPELELELSAGTPVSLFPLAPARGTLSEGLRWSVAGLHLEPGGRIGTSNAATGGRVRIGFDTPRMLVILPAAALGQVALRLRGA